MHVSADQAARLEVVLNPIWRPPRGDYMEEASKTVRGEGGGSEILVLLKVKKNELPGSYDQDHVVLPAEGFIELSQ